MSLHPWTVSFVTSYMPPKKGLTINISFLNLKGGKNVWIHANEGWICRLERPELPSSENHGNWYHVHALDAPLKVTLNGDPKGEKVAKSHGKENSFYCPP